MTSEFIINPTTFNNIIIIGNEFNSRRLVSFIIHTKQKSINEGIVTVTDKSNILAYKDVFSDIENIEYYEDIGTFSNFTSKRINSIGKTINTEHLNSFSLSDFNNFINIISGTSSTSSTSSSINANINMSLNGNYIRNSQIIILNEMTYIPVAIRTNVDYVYFFPKNMNDEQYTKIFNTFCSINDKIVTQLKEFTADKECIVIDLYELRQLLKNKRGSIEYSITDYIKWISLPLS